MRQSHRTSRPSASVLMISIVVPERARTMSPGFIARPLDACSRSRRSPRSRGRAARAARSRRSPRAPPRRRTCRTSSPTCSARGLIEMPPESNVTALPTRPSTGPDRILGRVPQRDQLRLLVRALGDGGERAHPGVADLLAPEHLALQAELGRRARARAPPAGSASSRWPARSAGRARRSAPRRRPAALGALADEQLASRAPVVVRRPCSCRRRSGRRRAPRPRRTRPRSGPLPGQARGPELRARGRRPWPPRPARARRRSARATRGRRVSQRLPVGVRRAPVPRLASPRRRRTARTGRSSVALEDADRDGVHGGISGASVVARTRGIGAGYRSAHAQDRDPERRPDPRREAGRRTVLAEGHRARRHRHQGGAGARRRRRRGGRPRRDGHRAAGRPGSDPLAPGPDRGRDPARRSPRETINKVCASGIRAVGMLDQAIRAGDIEVGVGGGMESMSNAPYMLPQRALRLPHGRRARRSTR